MKTLTKSLVAVSLLAAVTSVAFLVPLAFADEANKTYQVISVKGKAVTYEDGERVVADATLTMTVVVENQPIQFKGREVRKLTVLEGTITIGAETYTLDAANWKGLMAVNGKYLAARGPVSHDGATFRAALLGKFVEHTPGGDHYRILGRLVGDDERYRLGFLTLVNVV